MIYSSFSIRLLNWFRPLKNEKITENHKNTFDKYIQLQKYILHYYKSIGEQDINT